MHKLGPPEPNLGRLRQAFNVARADSGHTFDELAELTGLSRRTLLNISSGTTTGDLRTWMILSKVWGTPLDDLLSVVWA